MAEANTATPKIWWVTNDHLGRPVQRADAAKTVVWRAHDRPFGELVSATGSGDSDMRFPGQWFQMEAGLAWNWHRHDDASLGRYTQPDPLGLVDGPSVYGYVGGNPVHAIDPEGKLAWYIAPLIGAFVGAVLDWMDQYFRQEGNLSCIDYGEVAGAAAAGAVFSSTGPSGVIFGRGGKEALSMGYRSGIFNTGHKRLGWSWNKKKGKIVFSYRKGSGKIHHDLPGVGVDGPSIGRFGFGGGILGGAITSLGGRILEDCECSPN